MCFLIVILNLFWRRPVRDIVNVDVVLWPLIDLKLSVALNNLATQNNVMLSPWCGPSRTSAPHSCQAWPDPPWRGSSPRPQQLSSSPWRSLTFAKTASQLSRITWWQCSFVWPCSVLWVWYRADVRSLLVQVFHFLCLSNCQSLPPHNLNPWFLSDQKSSTKPS